MDASPVPTRRFVVPVLPETRATRCSKCPFGGAGLDAFERLRALTVRQRIAENPDMLWGCHEDNPDGPPQVCAGFAKAHRDRLEKLR